MMLIKAPLTKALLATGLAIGLTPVLGADPAYACSCIAAKEKKLYKWADVVFKGKVTKKKELHGEMGMSGGGHSMSPSSVVYTFTPTRSYKGKVAKPQKVTTAGDSAACGVNLDGQGPFLVFANRPEPTNTSLAAKKPLTISLCGGTREFTKGEVPSFGKGKKIP